MKKKTAPEDKRKYVKTLNELAEALRVTRQTIFTWRKLESSPKTDKGGLYCVDEWLDFQAKVRNKALAPDELNKFKIEKLKLENLERQMKIEERRKLLIPRELVRTTWAAKVGKARSVMQAKFELELPPLMVGKDAPTIQELMIEALDEVFLELSMKGV